MKVFTKDLGSLNLSKSNFLSSGGEGSVYVKNNKAFKIYQDKSKTIPESKIKELSSINLPYIIKPINSISDESNNNIGYYMNFVKDTESLCKLFTKSYKTRNNVDDKKIFNLITQLKTGVQHCHDNNILIVDMNELNFLVSKDCKQLYFIDVDSYQTKSFKATAIMESIRDRHNKTFSEFTDWFSYGIITFQMLTGIHPYKGKHNKYNTMDDRMLNNVSVLNKDVKVPKIVSDFNNIPQVYLDWYMSVFENGNRIEPPESFDNVVIVQPVIKKVENYKQLVIDLWSSVEENIIDVFQNSSDIYIVTNSKLYKNDKPIMDLNNKYKFILSEKYNDVYAVSIKKDCVCFSSISNKNQIEININIDSFMFFDNRLYIKNNDSIIELNLKELTNDKVIISNQKIANVMPFASHFYDGCLVQNLLSTLYVSIFPEKNRHHQIKLDKLEGHRIIDAKYQKQILIILSESKGIYYHHIYKFSKDFQDFTIRKIKDTNSNEMNFTVLDNGVVVYKNTEEHLELFSSSIKSNEVKEIKEDIEDINLISFGTSLFFTKENSFYKIIMK